MVRVWRCDRERVHLLRTRPHSGRTAGVSGLPGGVAHGADVAMKNWSMDLLKYRAFPELGAAVRARRDMIIERWQHAVRQPLPAANELTLKDVRNRLPDTLLSMAEALEADEPKATKDLMDQAMAHGETRFDQ